MAVDSPARAPLRPDLLRDLLVVPQGRLRRLEVVDETASTNAHLAAAVAADPDAWPAPALLLAEHQGAGRGRLDRSWEAPARAAVLASVLLRPDVPAAARPWLPLLTGLAVVGALRATAAVEAALKWPNDIVLPEGDGDASAGELSGWGRARKVAGILAEVLPDGGIVVGLGLNVSQTRGELPVPSATSLALAGSATTDRNVLLAAFHDAFVGVLGRWLGAGGDVVAAGLDVECAAACATIGRAVRVDLTGGGRVSGEAVGLGPDGALLVRADDGTVDSVHSGDVYHVRG